MRKLVTAAVSTALCLGSLLPAAAAAQEYRFAGFDAPLGATATVNLRVPLGQNRANRRASYGLTLGYGRIVPPGLDGRTASRAVDVADFRFAGGDLAQARLASFDLANLDGDPRLNMVGGKKSFLLIGVVIGAALVICLAADCFDGDDAEPAN